MLYQLAAASAAWKEQFREPPDVSLKWEIDDAGMLCLDGVWLCPAKCFRPDGEIEITQVSMELTLDDGYLTVIITKFADQYELVGVERSVRFKRT